MRRSSWLALAALLAPTRGVLMLVRRLRAGECAPARCAEPAAHASLAVLKVPRTGSTWLAKELRAFAGVQLEFEPFTDSSVRACAGRFFTQALGKALAARLRCVTREYHSQPCYWAWQHCNASRLAARPLGKAAAAAAGPTVLTGFLINPMYAPGANWNRALALQPRSRYVWLRRTNLVKMASTHAHAHAARMCSRELPLSPPRAPRPHRPRCQP